MLLVSRAKDYNWARAKTKCECSWCPGLGLRPSVNAPVAKG